ncbi:hypothetical protein ACYJ1Y_06325 [Natrialbaceae archaeon A-gly3]
MTRELTALGSVTYELVDELQFAIKASIVGVCVGVGTAAYAGGPLLARVLAGALVAAIVACGIYVTLLTLADRLTGGSHTYRLVLPADGPQPNGSRGRTAFDGGRSTDDREGDR